MSDLVPQLRKWSDETLDDPAHKRAWLCGEAADTLAAVQEYASLENAFLIGAQAAREFRAILGSDEAGGLSQT